MTVNTVRDGPRRQGRHSNTRRKQAGRAVYAGSPQDHTNHRISPNNPWRAYMLPRDWKPLCVAHPASNSSGSRVSFTPTELDEAARATALERLPGRRIQVAQAFVPSFAPARGVPRHDVRRAVVVDTESVQSKLPGAMRGSNLVASVCVADFLTGETLLDIGVLPEAPVTMFTPWINGITAQWYHEKRRAGNLVQGAAQARELLSRFIDDSTVVIGHALANDENALLGKGRRFCRRYDTQSRLDPGSRSLRDASPVHCQEGKHSALEDVLATRELALEQLGLAHGGEYLDLDGCPYEASSAECNLDWGSEPSSESSRPSTPRWSGGDSWNANGGSSHCEIWETKKHLEPKLTDGPWGLAYYADP